MDIPPLAITDAPSKDDVVELGERLYEYNVEKTGCGDGRYLAIFLKDDDGRLKAGLFGWTWAGCCGIEKLWIDKPWRGHGLGTRLMQAAEAEARARGAELMLLDTLTFQAPGFYEKLGFRRVAAVDDHPVGYQRFTMRKRLTTTPKEDGPTA